MAATIHTAIEPVGEIAPFHAGIAGRVTFVRTGARPGKKHPAAKAAR